MLKIFTFIFLLTLGNPGASQDVGPLLHKLEGIWCGKSGERMLCESWKQADGNTYHGKNFRISEKDTVLLENLAIQKMEEHWFYLAAPKGQIPAAFNLEYHSKDTLIFTNWEHDFPQQIMYTFPDDNSLVVYVSDKPKAGERKKQFQLVFQRQSATNSNQMDTPKKVTGIGGIFFKSADPKSLKEWYAKNLGLPTDQYGTLFEFRLADDPDTKGHLQWSPFAENTNYFQPSEKQFMINYRVENLEALVKELKEAGVTICDEIETYPYGKFVHIMDPEGNKLELWEPIKEGF